MLNLGKSEWRFRSPMSDHFFRFPCVKMAYSDTLLIRHLPSSLSEFEIEDFLKHIGAVEVTNLKTTFKKQVAFAKFKSKNAAAEVLFRLHQQELLGSRLIVEFADSTKLGSRENRDEVEKNDKKTTLYETFLRNLNNWTVGLNFMVPPPCHLRYRYPPPSSQVLLNIANMLSCSTKFYTQVLHLMNKMNLPSPFETSFPLQQNEIFNSFILYILENTVYECQQEKEVQESSDEDSELDSDSANSKIRPLAPQKRSLPPKKLLKRRKLFRPVTGATSTNKTTVKEVFDQVERDPVRKIEVRMPTEISVTEPTPIAEEASGFGVIHPPVKSHETESEKVEDENVKGCISATELAANRISERDRKVLSVFRNYKSGIPSCRLYIKNLSKHVTVADLNYIFRRYFIEGIDEQGTMFDIRLMQEGRMKGQAFVTLQNVKQAELALKETNGFIFKNKPMIVQFARSAVSK